MRNALVGPRREEPPRERGCAAADRDPSAAGRRTPSAEPAEARRSWRSNVTSWRARLVERTDEPSLSSYYSAARSHESGHRNFLTENPSRSLDALIAVTRLPTLSATLSKGVEGRAILAALLRPALFRTPLGATSVAVLAIPADAREYSLGAGKQTLRRKVRSAQRRGIVYRSVAVSERAELLLRANMAEQDHADEQYRVSDPQNTDLLRYGLWLAAFSADGTPLMLCVTPTDGQWALLRYFRTLGSGPEYSDSRYLMCQALVDELSARGVRYLVDSSHPIDLQNGLRHFQRMVGFRLARVVPKRPWLTFAIAMVRGSEH